MLIAFSLVSTRISINQEKRERAEEEKRKKQQALVDAEKAEIEKRQFEDMQRRVRLEKAADAEIALKAGRYEDAAKLYEELGEFEKAGDCRRQGRTQYVVSTSVHIGNEGISVDCPHCGASQPIRSKNTNEVTCAFCNRKYVIPEKILKLL